MTPLEYDRTRIWHPYASLKNPPPVLHAKAASGVEIELADGSRLVDAVSSWWCVAHGHNHPAIVEAIRRQSEKMCHVNPRPGRRTRREARGDCAAWS